MTGWRVVPLAEAPVDGVLRALDEALGPGHDEAWLVWKHRQNPFGPSLGWAAVAPGGGVLGVRLLMRWRLVVGGRDSALAALRPVDTATLAVARRRGIFRALTAHALEAAREAGAALLFNNPNRSSLPGYQRLGWRVLPPHRLAWRPVLPGPTAELVEDDAALEAVARAPMCPGRLATERSRRWLGWRYGESSGHGYGLARLAGAEEANGLIYRVVVRRRLRTLSVLEIAGRSGERRLLARSAARREGARALVEATGEGASLGLEGMAALRRRGPVLAVRPLEAIDPDPARLGSWALSLGDLEGWI